MMDFNNNYNNDSSAFGGTQLGGGGGFGIDSQIQPTPMKKVINQNQRTLMPLTAKQILNAPKPMDDEGLKVDDIEITQCRIVGQIMSMKIQSQMTSFQVDDSTAVITVKMWQNEKNTCQDLQEGDYIEAVGKINLFQNMRSVNAFFMKKIEDFNEISMHLLECLHAHLYNTKKPHLQQRGNNNNNNNMNVNNMNNMSNMNNNMHYNNMNNNNYNNNNNMNPNMNPNMNQSMNQSMNMGMDGMNMDQFGDETYTDLQKKILSVIESYQQSEEGCLVNHIFSAIPATDVNIIRTEIQELADSGALYSTIDEEHFKLTSG